MSKVVTFFIYLKIYEKVILFIKRAEVICLDVGSTMDIREKDGTNHFELSIKALVLLLEQKVSV
jgi:hypothetical protein